MGVTFKPKNMDLMGGQQATRSYIYLLQMGGKKPEKSRGA